MAFILDTYSRNADLLNFDDYKDYWTDFSLRKYIASTPPTMQLRVLGKGKPPDILQYGVSTIVSGRFVKTLENLGAELCVQLFPVDIFLKQGKWDEQHYVLHVINKVDCIDSTKSKFKTRNDIKYDICPLVLNEDKIQKTDFVFTLANASYTSIFMNNDAKEQFTKAKLSKVEFHDIHDWNNSIMNPDNNIRFEGNV